MTDETIRVLAERDAVTILALVIFAGMVVFLLGVRVYATAAKQHHEQNKRITELAEQMNLKTYAVILETQKDVKGVRQDNRIAWREVYRAVEDMKIALKRGEVRDDQILIGLTRIETMVSTLAGVPQIKPLSSGAKTQDKNAA